MRLRQEESLHGTESGQLVVSEGLMSRFGLTGREAACAALLASGATQVDIAQRLRISRSTAAKHLASLRRKLGAKSTADAIAHLSRLAAREAQIPSHVASTGIPFSAKMLRDEEREFALRAADAGSLSRTLELLVEHLGPWHVGAVVYGFLPLGAASFREGDFIECVVAPREIGDAHRRAGGIAANPISHAIFADPDRVVVIDGEDPAYRTSQETRVSDPLLDACLAAGFRFGVGLGSPFGSGFVAATFLISDDAGLGVAEHAQRTAEAARSGLLLAHNAAFSFGALAAVIALSVRERDALSRLAQGDSSVEAAAALGISGRAMTKLVGSARRKLGARTTNQALCKAMALNALVFL